MKPNVSKQYNFCILRLSEPV